MTSATVAAVPIARLHATHTQIAVVIRAAILNVSSHDGHKIVVANELYTELIQNLYYKYMKGKTQVSGLLNSNG